MVGVRFVLWALFVLALSGCGQAESDKKATSSEAPAATAEQVETSKVAEDSKPQACRIVMGWDPWEPYHYQSADKQVVGLDIELVTAVVKNAGCEVSYYRQGWAKLLKMVKDGQVDILAGATKTPSRESFAYFTDVYRNEEFYLYVENDRLSDFQEKNFQQLMDNGFRLGVIQGYLYSDAVTKIQDEKRYQGQFMESSMSEINVSLLLDGQIDGFLEDKFVGASIIRRKNLANTIKPLPVEFEKSGVSMMVSKSSVGEKMFKRLNKSLLELKEKGEIQAILTSYQN